MAGECTVHVSTVLKATGPEHNLSRKTLQMKAWVHGLGTKSSINVKQVRLADSISQILLFLLVSSWVG